MSIPYNFKNTLGWSLVISFVLIAAWELYWRNRGYTLSYNDDPSAWVMQRKKIEDGTNEKLVLIGSSRLKFDIDLPTLHEAIEVEPIQLALEGTSPVNALHDLANNSKFKGVLLVGVTEGLFFAPQGQRPHQEVKNRIDVYNSWTLAQEGSFYINRILESVFVFLDTRSLNLNRLLSQAPIPPRPNVRMAPVFPFDFVSVDRNRQTKMTDKFLNDTTLQRQVKNVWLRVGGGVTKRGVGGDTLTQIMDQLKVSVEKLRSRGVQVLFVRPPSDGQLWQAEQIAYPRELYWDRLLTHTQSKGVHFADYPELSAYKCAEWSHITPYDAVPFTQQLIDILKKEKGLKLLKEQTL